MLDPDQGPSETKKIFRNGVVGGTPQANLGHRFELDTTGPSYADIHTHIYTYIYICREFPTALHGGFHPLPR